MASDFGGGFTQGLAQSLSRLPELLLQVQSMQQQKEAAEERRKTNKLQARLIEQKLNAGESLASMFVGPTKETEALDVPLGEIERVPGGRIRAALARSGEIGTAVKGLAEFEPPGAIAQFLKGQEQTGAGLKEKLTGVGEALPPGASVTEKGLTIQGPQRPATGMSGLQEQIVRDLATSPETGQLDPNVAAGVIQRLRTNPQGAESRIFDIRMRQLAGQPVHPGELEAIEAWKKDIFGIGAQRTGGGETGRLGVRRTPEFQQTEADVNQARAEARLKGSPLGEVVVQKGTAMRQSVRIVEQILSEFSPEERAKFVGFFKFPLNKLLQIERGDPRFAQFLVLINQAKGAAFGEGGKQLTPFEASVVFGYVPSGTELSAVDFEAKLQNSLKQTPLIYNDLIGLSRTPKSKLQPLETKPVPKGTAPGAKSSGAKEERLDRIFGGP